MTPRILKNAVRCKSCGDVIESRTRHDFVSCSCGKCHVDGGHDYLKRCMTSSDCYEEMSEWEGMNVENAPETGNAECGISAPVPKEMLHQIYGKACFSILEKIAARPCANAESELVRFSGLFLKEMLQETENEDERGKLLHSLHEMAQKSETAENALKKSLALLEYGEN